MPRPQPPTASTLPSLVEGLSGLTVDNLKWYAALLPTVPPMRKADITAMMVDALTGVDQVRRLWEMLTPRQQEVVAAALYDNNGVYDLDVVDARFPGVSPPAQPDYSSYFYGSGKKRHATAFDLFFATRSDFGRYIAPEVATVLRSFVPPPAPSTMRSLDEVPTVLADPRYPDEVVEVMVADTERAVFHDLAATLALVQAGKVSVSSATRLPTLASVRLLRQRLLLGDYFAGEEYERAEDAIRPLALVMLVQAAKWAAPASSAGSKLELTRAGQAVLAGSSSPGGSNSLRPEHVREAWERWLKTDLLDELSRVRAIRGQQSRETRLTKPAERREKLARILRDSPVERWVEFDEFLRYMRAESQLPDIERNIPSNLYIGSDFEFGWLGYDNVKYWDLAVGTYLRATLWEYAATLGIVDIAYTRPEESPHDFDFEVYDLGDLGEEYVSRYDGLLALRLTGLGAYVLGLSASYTPPALAAPEGPPLLRVLPNLDLVVTAIRRMMPNERAFLERIAMPQSDVVYHLSREKLLDAAQQGLTVEEILRIIATMSGLSETEFPQTVRVLFSDLQRKLGALTEGERMLVLESGDDLVLIELAHSRQLAGLVHLGKVGERTVLLVPESSEAPVRKHLKKLGYVPGKQRNPA